MDFEKIFQLFAAEGEFVSAVPFGNGHINDTIKITTRLENGDEKHYVLQRINKKVFNHPECVMANIIGVTDFIRRHTKGENNPTLSLVWRKNGTPYCIDDSGEFWRAYDFVENSVSQDLPDTDEDFYNSAVAFGAFQRILSEYPADTLCETIPNFHNTPVRFANLMKAVENDAVGRAAGVAAEIAFAKEREEFCEILEKYYREGELPLRVTHNDTKMNNVLLDAKTKKPLCVVDLDTIMPGYSVNDFGDSIRFGANTAAEDETDLSKVKFDLHLYEVYLKGFIEGCDGRLTDHEISLLPVGAKMMTLECGMRFLTDYLEGDHYFKVKYPEHNLVRCRTQFKLVEEMEKVWDKMVAVAERYKGEAK